MNDKLTRAGRDEASPAGRGEGERFPEKHTVGPDTDIPNVYPEEIPIYHSDGEPEFRPVRGTEVLGVTDFGIMDNPCRTISDPPHGAPGPDAVMPERFDTVPSGEL